MKREMLMFDGEPVTPELLLRLQRQVGNRAVLKLLRALRRQAEEQAKSARTPDRKDVS